MDKEKPIRSYSKGAPTKWDSQFSVLSRKILSGANRGLSRNTFFKSMLQLLHDASQCDAVELRLIDLGKLQLCELNPKDDKIFRMKQMLPRRNRNDDLIPCAGDGTGKERLCQAVVDGHFDPEQPHYTKLGSFFTGDTSVPLKIYDCQSPGGNDLDLLIGGEFASMAIIAFTFENEIRGLLILKSRRKDYFSVEDVEYFEEVGHIISIAIAHWRAQIALGERVKELTCLCGMAKIASRPDISIPEILRETVELLPGAWRFPDIAVARILCDAIAYTTTGFRAGLQSLSADIVVNGKKRGTMEVAYIRKVREYDEGPFLKEERNLIDAMADEVALIIQRREAEEKKGELEEQLRHADRLATIGQLASGVAHELNEPLANILGFAQLISRNPQKPGDIGKDVDKIIAASLHARTVIERLNLFARQSPQKKGLVDLNRVINEGLYFLESRCAKAGIEMLRVLSPDLPEVFADQGQMYQVLVNLVVNAIQAMPDGGRLTIRTDSRNHEVGFSVEDTGTGMDDAVQRKIFVPFFTTKDVNEGTGLGLAVVHGIVSAHGGSISVESKVGKGSLFEIRLPLT